MTGSNHISQYRQSALPVQTGTYSDGRPIYTFYADNAAQNGPTFNVSDYGATGDGVTDDTAAIQAALDAAGAVGGAAYLPAGVYKTTAALVLNYDNMLFYGAGWGAVIQGASGSSHDLLTTPIPPASGTAGYARFQVLVRDLKLDGSLQAGTTAGQGNLLHFYGARYCQIEHIWCYHGANWSILLDGDGTPNFSYNNKITRCRIDGKNAATGTAGIFSNSSEANEIRQNDILGICAATTAAQPAFNSPTTQSTTPYHIWAQSGFILIEGNMLGESGAYTTECIRIDSGAPSRIIGNEFDECSSVGLNSIIELGDNDGGNVIVGNAFGASNNAPHYQYCVREVIAGTPTRPNIVADNTIINAGTQGFAIFTATSPSRTSGNAGYNPVGHFSAQPAVPATTVAYTNTLGADATVYVTGGTVTAIAVGGVATGLTAGAFRVSAGQTITLTYSVAPTWQWYGD